MVRGLISERSYPWVVEPGGAQRLDPALDFRVKAQAVNSNAV